MKSTILLAYEAFRDQGRYLGVSNWAVRPLLMTLPSLKLTSTWPSCATAVSVRSIAVLGTADACVPSTGNLSARSDQCAFWLKAAEIASRNRWKCAYFCVLMLTILSRDSDRVTLSVVDRTFVGLLTDCWGVWVSNDLISSAHLS